MTMPSRSTRKTGGRSGSRSLLRGGCSVFLLLAGIVSITLASHSTTTWDFGTASDYTYDANKIEVQGGVAKLRKAFSVTHNSQAVFDTGTHSGTVYNTS